MMTTMIVIGCVVGYLGIGVMLGGSYLADFADNDNWAEVGGGQILGIVLLWPLFLAFLLILIVTGWIPISCSHVARWIRRRRAQKPSADDWAEA